LREGGRRTAIALAKAVRPAFRSADLKIRRYIRGYGTVRVIRNVGIDTSNDTDDGQVIRV